ncbi:MAG: hypothetical protein NT062_34395 [Proteobacteria bacterium]|nr:hypothetical protein [Pseudomonadota bacterium]
MTKPPTLTKLFAVVVSTSAMSAMSAMSATASAETPRMNARARPACGNVMTKNGDACDDAPTPIAVNIAALRTTIAAMFAALPPPVAPPSTADVPRMLANGRPACGNVASKRPRPTSCAVVASKP